MPNLPELLEKAGILKPTKAKRIRKGDIVQITDEDHALYPALVIVERLGTSIKGYITLAGSDQETVMDPAQIKVVGFAKIVRVLTPPEKETS